MRALELSPLKPTHGLNGPPVDGRVLGKLLKKYVVKRFRNHCGLIKAARSGFPREKTTNGDVASVYTHCETAQAC